VLAVASARGGLPRGQDQRDGRRLEVCGIIQFASAPPRTCIHWKQSLLPHPTTSPPPRPPPPKPPPSDPKPTRPTKKSISQPPTPTPPLPPHPTNPNPAYFGYGALSEKLGLGKGKAKKSKKAEGPVVLDEEDWIKGTHYEVQKRRRAAAATKKA